MAISTQCPTCKTTITVDDKMAGRTGKCKCGAAITIPAATVAAGGLGGALDELTESDYNRSSPLQNIYAPPKSNEDKQALKRFEAEGAPGAKKVQPGKLTGNLIATAVLLILSGIGSVFAIVMFAALSTVLAKVAEQVPALKIGIPVGIALFSLLAIVQLGGAVGIFMKKQWGWALAAASFSFTLVDSIARFVTLIQTGFAIPKFLGSLIGFAIVLGVLVGLFSDDTAKVFRLKSKMVGFIAAGVGALIAIGVMVAAWQHGAFSADAS